MPNYPAGLIPVLADPFPALHGRRTTSYTVEVRDRDGNTRGLLDGVDGGTVEYDYATRLMAGGKLAVRDTGQTVDWLNDRISIAVEVNGTSWDVGLFIPTMPGANWTQGHRGWEVELHSILLVLDQDSLEQSYTVVGAPDGTGTKVSDAVTALIESAGESAGTIEPSDERLQTSLTWEPGTPKLTMINDLLDAGGYFALRIDGSGNLIAEKYVKPSGRSPQIVFQDGVNCIFVDDFTDNIDLFAIPNKVIAVGEGSGGLPGWVGSAVNDDPDDPYSTASRGRTIVKPYLNVKATSTDSINRYAQQRLSESASPRRKIEIQHGPVELQVSQAVTFRYSPGGIDGKFVVDKTTVSVDPLGLQTTVLRSV